MNQVVNFPALQGRQQLENLLPGKLEGGEDLVVDTKIAIFFAEIYFFLLIVSASFTCHIGTYRKNYRFIRNIGSRRKAFYIFIYR